MKAKLYSQLEYLKAKQASDYLCYLAGVSATDAVDILVDYANQGDLVFYCEFYQLGSPPLIIEHNKASWDPENPEVLSIIEPMGRQRHEQGLLLVQTDEGVGALVPHTQIHCAIEFYGKASRDPFTPTKQENWSVSGKCLLEDLGDPISRIGQKGDLIRAEVSFLRTDIEALAAQMNDEPDPKALQEENQRLRQDLETLKAEVERLQDENQKLKKDDDTRQIKNMAKVIYGMALSKYQYNPELQRNGATGVIARAMQAQGIQTTPSTIKRYIDTGKTALEEDGE